MVNTFYYLPIIYGNPLKYILIDFDRFVELGLHLNKHRIISFEQGSPSWSQIRSDWKSVGRDDREIEGDEGKIEDEWENTISRYHI